MTSRTRRACLAKKEGGKQKKTPPGLHRKTRKEKRHPRRHHGNTQPRKPIRQQPTAPGPRPTNTPAVGAPAPSRR